MLISIYTDKEKSEITDTQVNVHCIYEISNRLARGINNGVSIRFQWIGIFDLSPRLLFYRAPNLLFAALTPIKLTRVIQIY